MNDQLSFAAAAPVVPEPLKGSRITSPSSEELSTRSSMIACGFTVGWPYNILSFFIRRCDPVCVTSLVCSM